MRTNKKTKHTKININKLTHILRKVSNNKKLCKKK